MSLPQIYASEASLAASDRLRDTARASERAADQDGATLPPDSQRYAIDEPTGYYYKPQAHDFSSDQAGAGHRVGGLPAQVYTSNMTTAQFQASLPLGGFDAPLSVRNTQSARQAFQPRAPQPPPVAFAASAQLQRYPRHVQRPQSGIRSVPKEQQAGWAQITSRGAFQYRGDTFAFTMSQHLPKHLVQGHADGPQHIKPDPHRTALPDAERREANSTQPTFRWFRRTDYSGVKDRWSQRDGIGGRGDSTYRPYSVQEQQAITARTERRKALKGKPRTGEW